MSILQALAKGTVLGDGGYVLELERRGYIQAGPFTPEAVLEAPAAVEALHVEFKRAGAQVLQALTFYGDGGKLSVVGLDASVERINREAVRIARHVAGSTCWVAGGLTQTQLFQPGASSQPAAERAWAEQLEVQCVEGVDLLVGETFLRLEEAECALRVMRRTGRPVMLTMNAGVTGTLDGFSPAECARRLGDQGADVVGINCSWDPWVSLELAAQMRAATHVPIACQPIGFRTPVATVPFTRMEEFPLALESLQMTRFELADFARRAEERGIRFIGGCCGVAPYHIRSMAEALGRTVPASAKSPDLARHVIPEVRAKDDASYWKPLHAGSDCVRR